MTIAIGDKVTLDAGWTAAEVVSVLEDGAIEAKIDHPGHPGDGQITRVGSGNFALGTVDFNAQAVKPVPVERPAEQPAPSVETVSAGQTAGLQDQLDEYHTVTR